MNIHSFASEGKSLYSKQRQFCDCAVNKNDTLVDMDSCQAPHLADLMTATYLPEQRTDINELNILWRQIRSFGSNVNDEIMFDQIILDQD